MPGKTLLRASGNFEGSPFEAGILLAEVFEKFCPVISTGIDHEIPVLPIVRVYGQRITAVIKGIHSKRSKNGRFNKNNNCSG